MPADLLPLAPACPCWCDEDHDHGWLVHPAAVTKTCRHSVAVGDDLDGEPVTVDVERFAYVEDGAVTIEEPTMRASCFGRLDAARLLLFAETLIHCAALIATKGAVAA